MTKIYSLEQVDLRSATSDKLTQVARKMHELEKLGEDPNVMPLIRHQYKLIMAEALERIKGLEQQYSQPVTLETPELLSGIKSISDEQ